MSPIPPTDFPVQKLFVLLFTMTGPLRVVPMFASLTAKWEPDERNRLALHGVLYAAVGILLAIFVGHSILKSWGASPQALAAATGLLLLLTALQPLLGLKSAQGPEQGTIDLQKKHLALSPLAFSTIVPPFAVGVLILFGANFPDLKSQMTMAGLAIGLLAVDFVAMRFSQQIMRFLGPSLLQILGAVFGVLQLSLAIQMILWALSTFST